MYIIFQHPLPKFQVLLDPATSGKSKPQKVAPGENKTTEVLKTENKSTQGATRTRRLQARREERNKKQIKRKTKNDYIFKCGSDLLFPGVQAGRGPPPTPRTQAG